MKKISSPNFDTRASGVALQYVVLHYTGIKDAQAALSRLCDPASKVSAHYMIDEDGSLTELVDEKDRAWHAGKSYWRGITDMNSASIGIELVNPGHEFGYRAFPNAQITVLKILLQGILERHNMNPTSALLAHSDIAPSRKTDPGELFPWQNLAKDNLGTWPAPLPQDYDPTHEAGFTALLMDIGYECEIPRDTLVAFQRRYHPERLGKGVDAETVARLRALKRQLT